MATLPTSNYDRRPTPKFGRVNQYAPVVNDPDIVEGAAISNLGNAMVTTFRRLQIQEDKYMVEEATTKGLQASLDLRQGENGYLGVKEDGIGETFHEDQMQRFDEAWEVAGEGLQNSAQRRAFNAKKDLARVNYGAGLINHITAEKEARYQRTYKTSIITHAETAASNKYDGMAIEQSRDNIIKSTRDELDRKQIWNQATRDLAEKENLTLLHTKVIQGMVNDGNYTLAREHYEGDPSDSENNGFKSEILTETQSDIEKLLESAGEDDRSIRFVDAMWEDYKNDQKGGQKFIRDTADPADRDAIMDRFNTRHAEEDEIQKDEWADLYEKNVSVYLNAMEPKEAGGLGLTPSEAYYSIPKSDREAMKQSHRLNLYNMMQADSRGTAIHTDPDTFMDLYELSQGTRRDLDMTPAEQKAYFREKVDLRDYPLSVAHRSFFAAQQASVDKVVLASTLAELKKEVATVAGYYDKKTGKRKNATGAFEVNERFDAELAKLQESTGKTATPTDERAIADRLKIEIVRKMPWYRKDQTMIAVAAEIEGVPTEMIDEIAFRLYTTKQQLLDAGETSFTMNGETYPLTEDFTVTVEEIQNYYDRAKGGTAVPQPQPAIQRLPYATPFDRPMLGARE
jgi:hypothetical protein